MLDYFERIIEGAMFTHMANAFRFQSAAVNTHNRSLYPYRYRTGATLDIVACSDDMQIVYLCPEESADDTYNRLTGGKFKYDSRYDVDRYLLKCGFGNEEFDRCPAWQELRKMLAVKSADVAVAVGGKNFVRIEDDPAYGEVGTAYVGYGDGAIGPIASKLCCSRWNPFDAVLSCCQTCEFKRTHGNDDSDHADDNAHGNAENSNGDCGYRENVAKVKVYAHGGIIAFFKRLFDWRDARRPSEGE